MLNITSHYRALPAHNSTHQIDTFAAEYAGTPFALYSDPADWLDLDAESILRAAQIPYTCDYMLGLFVEADYLPKVMYLFDLSTLTVQAADESMITLIREELVGNYDPTDGGGYAAVMFEMIHQAECFRESVADIYASDGRDDEGDLLYNYRAGYPDIGI